MIYKVLIPTAGLGTRLGDLSKNINKSLISIATKPVISHIIDKFPTDIEIVVALGYKGNLVRDFLELAYPDRKITFVDIDKFHGVGSGLGYTISKCQEHLRCPFIFCSNDTIVDENIPIPNTNWIGYAIQDSYDAKKYRSIKKLGGVVTELCEKESKDGEEPYIGLAGIHDYEIFWDAMNEGVNYGSINIGESYGLKKIINKSSIYPKAFTWYDTGSIDGLHAAKSNFKKDSDPNILDKTDESIWFVNGMVIKYSADDDFITKRIKRTKYLDGFVPEIISSRKNMYSYREIKGNVLSKDISIPMIERFMHYIGDMWGKCIELDNEYKIKYSESCKSFYQEKTYQRVNQFLNIYRQNDTKNVINGVDVPRIYDLLKEIDWDLLSTTSASSYHGDLHFENILVSEDGNFVLLDWRQDFGGICEYGDCYYDLAKLLHGMIVSHEIVNNDLFYFEKEDNIIKIDILRNYKLVECEKWFMNYLNKNNYHIYKVLVLTSLIFINISPLHHDPYSQFLFYLGKYQLNNLLSNGDLYGK